MGDLKLIEINEGRCLRLIRNCIDTFKLDLRGLVILTEAATGYYVLTPMIAALGGADRVFALTKDSHYGSAQMVKERTMTLADQWGLTDRIEVLFSPEDERVGLADIVTNLGFIRPLDAPFLRRLRWSAVIPLMFETWEYRSEDLDFAECRRLDIPVLGTNEHHPHLQIFGYIGHIALKLLLMVGIELFRTKIIVIGSGEFAQQTLITLRAVGAEVTLLSPRIKGQLKSAEAQQAFREGDAVVVVEHYCRSMLIGTAGEIEAGDLYALNPHLVVVHICGPVDRAELERVGLRCYPGRFAPPGHMSVTTDYLGPRPMIDLHTAGLKVGEELARARVRGLTALGTELAVLRKTPLAEGFVGYHDIQDLMEGND